MKQFLVKIRVVFTLVFRLEKIEKIICYPVLFFCFSNGYRDFILKNNIQFFLYYCNEIFDEFKVDKIKMKNKFFKTLSLLR